ncbi:MAG TPA: FG-GAP-like repeat-containing protein [Methylomirabilota bacterium]|nr:FG-GAP-like repeat-containing protein [Methylomirabilota bacterium]
MTRLLSAVSVLLAAAQTVAWTLASGDPLGNRFAAGKGSFPRWQVLSAATDVPLKWVVSVSPRRLAAVDRDGTFWLFDITPAGLRVGARYGESVSPDAAPVVVRLDAEHAGLVLVAPDGRLLVWDDGVLRGYDVGVALSRLTFPAPVRVGAAGDQKLLAVAQDGAVVLIGGLAAGAPRVISRLDVRALPDARITVGDVDGDGAPEAVLLTEPTDRYAHGILGDRLEAGSVTVIGLAAYSLELKSRYSLPAPAVFEDLVPILAPNSGPLPTILLSRSAPGQGTSPVALGWREGGLVLLAEGPGQGHSHRWVHVIGAADLSGTGASEVAAVVTPHIGGVLTAYRKVGAALVRIARAPGYSSHAIGSRNLEQALIADLDGNGVPEIVVPRHGREAIAGVELQGDRFVERYALELRGPARSNLVAADLDGDGLLDLAVADRAALHVLLSVR